MPNIAIGLKKAHEKIPMEEKKLMNKTKYTQLLINFKVKKISIIFLFLLLKINKVRNRKKNSLKIY